MEKVCTKCGQSKPFSDYGVQRRRGREELRSDCKACRVIAGKAYYANNQTRQRQLQQQNYERTREERVRKMQEYHTANREQILARKSRYYGENVARFLAANAKRRAQEKSAAPGWDPELDEFVMSEAFELAKLRAAAFGGEWHVDHIVPLRAKTVCGLHNAFNVQVVPAKYNLRKNNRFNPQELTKRLWL